MRAFVAGTLIVFSCLLTPEVADAEPAVLSRSVAGAGVYAVPFGGPQVEVTINASVVGDGAATGSFRFAIPGLDYFSQADVTGIAVEASVAYVCGVVTAASQPETVGWKWVFSVQDNAASGTPDLIAPGFIGPFWGEGICDLRPQPELAFVSGHIAVTSCERFKDKPGEDKDKCKDKPARPVDADRPSPPSAITGAHELAPSAAASGLVTAGRASMLAGTPAAM